MFDVITVGSNTIDVFAKTDAKLIRVKTEHGPEEFIAYPTGSKILITQMDVFTGGGGTNTAVSFSRLGLRTAYLGKIGKDDNGLKIFKELQQEKIQFIGSLGDLTGYSVVLDSMHEDRTILTFKGCNNDLSFKEIQPQHLKTKWFYFSSMMGKSFETIEKLSRIAKVDGIKIAFNPSEYQVKQPEMLEPILQNTTVLIFNREEARILLKTEAHMDTMLKKIREFGPKIVVITDGKHGVYVFDGYWFWHANPRKDVKLVETTGAGDAFASSFIAGLILNRPIEDCIRMGMLNAESVISALGAKNILLYRPEILRRLKLDVKKRKVFKHRI